MERTVKLEVGTDWGEVESIEVGWLKQRVVNLTKTWCQWRREIPQNRRAEIPHFILI